MQMGSVSEELIFDIFFNLIMLRQADHAIGEEQRLGKVRASHKHNPLLVHAELGKPKKVSRNLPTDGMKLVPSTLRPLALSKTSGEKQTLQLYSMGIEIPCRPISSRLPLISRGGALDICSA